MEKGNPQVENGHIDIANEIAEKLCSYRISGEEWQILWVIFRKTYGWHKKEDWISLSQFVSFTGMKKPNVIRALNKLKNKNIIIKSDNGKEKSYAFNKHYNTWKTRIIKSDNKKVIKSDNNVIKSDNKSLSKVIPTKETIQKKLIQKKYNKEKIKFNSLTKKFENINPEDLKKWKEIFSDVERELEKMELWLTTHPHKRYRSYERFIFGWLNRKGREYGQKNNQRYFGITERISDEKKERLKGITNAKPGEW